MPTPNHEPMQAAAVNDTAGQAEVVGPTEWPSPQESTAPSGVPLWQQVQQALPTWRSIGASSTIQHWIQHGVPVPWLPTGPPQQFYGHQPEITP